MHPTDTTNSATAARAKHACPACGGEAGWNPAKRALVCPYCGTTVEAPTSDGHEAASVQEHDLRRGLAHAVSGRGWQAQKTSVVCQSCRAISVFDPERVSQACDFCGATALVPENSQEAPFRPESLVAMNVSEPRVRESIREWYGSRWFAPNGLGKLAMTDQVRGLYIPYWTFDAHVKAHWVAESGTYYYVTEQRDGKAVQVQKVRWQPTQGQLTHFFDDSLVAASRGVHAGLLDEVGQFDTSKLVPYDSSFLSGWVVERYQLDLDTASRNARQKMDQELRNLCGRQVPGDTHRNLVVNADYSGQTFKHILLPIWLLTYRYGARSYQAVINGQDGRIAGEYPLSYWKIAGALFCVLLAIVLFAALSDFLPSAPR